MNKITGTIKAISTKTNGLMINDIWYSATGELIGSLDWEMKGKIVTLQVDEKNKFKEMSFDNEVSYKAPIKSFADKKDETSKRIARMNAMSSGLKAVEIAIRSSKTEYTSKQVLCIAKVMADKVLDYVYERKISELEVEEETIQ